MIIDSINFALAALAITIATASSAWPPHGQQPKQEDKMKKHFFMACSVTSLAIGSASAVNALEGSSPVHWESVTTILLSIVGITGAVLRGHIEKQHA
ncbi:hypothetical protein [Burkholderia sp. Tr-20390]|uniref:hypothetical protein n=1 Tax=Burkholderia sp. Tr-20390 TaxID=2703904 RepID=UPI00197DC3D2|nr:hypothetical protein [Burkholderia sp. Tr-20390]MBN3729504.1 hypothetical protein [Burkholderia sp. Tr-20390]